MKKKTLFSLAAALVFFPWMLAAQTCDTMVNAPASIQDAIDAASSGDVICLDGTFSQSVVIGSAQSGITLRSAPGVIAVLDGTGTGAFEAIRLQDGVSGVTIQGLEIRYYISASCCGQGNAIQAWGVNTSNISVLDNNMHDNSYSAILVGSEGGQTHAGWAVHRNTATNNATAFFSAQIELTNCNGCSIHMNNVSGGTIGILVQGRNTVPDSGLVEIQGVSVKNNAVDSAVGAYVLSLASGPIDPFPPIVGAQTDLQDVSLAGNSITSPIWVYGFLGGKVTNPALVRNDVSCSGSYGIGLFGNVSNAKVVNNDDLESCSPLLLNFGDDTKNPPVPSNPS